MNSSEKEGNLRKESNQYLETDNKPINTDNDVDFESTPMKQKDLKTKDLKKISVEY